MKIENTGTAFTPIPQTPGRINAKEEALRTPSDSFKASSSFVTVQRSPSEEIKKEQPPHTSDIKEVPPENTDKKAVMGSFTVKPAHGGLYKHISGELGKKPVNISMDREAEIVDVGNGLYVEGDSIYKVRGDFAGIPLDLNIKSHAQIGDFDGIHIQTGTVYNITGKAGSRTINANIRQESQISSIGGLNIETGRVGILKGTDGDFPHITVKSVSETASAGAILVETERYHRVQGKDMEGDVDVRIDGFDANSKRFQIEGTAPTETLALIVSLKPFLDV